MLALVVGKINILLMYAIYPNQQIEHGSMSHCYVSMHAVAKIRSGAQRCFQEIPSMFSNTDSQASMAGSEKASEE